MNNEAFEKTKLSPGKTIIIGISGGPDSVALLIFLNEKKFPVIAAIFNHQLRKESDDDVIFVKNLAIKMGIPFVTENSDVRKYSETNSLTIEEAARILRYQFLFAQARKYNAQAVAVGHTEDDQAETILMHLIRGAGLHGLKGMLPSVILPIFDKNIPIIRPLLSWSRIETENYCKAAGIKPRIDQTNFDNHFFRNKIRQDLIPIIEKYNPNLKNSLSKTAKLLQGDLEIIENSIDIEWKLAVNQINSGYIEFNYSYLVHTTHAVRRHILRRAVMTLEPEFPGLDFNTLEKAQSLEPCTLPGGFRIEKEGDSLFLITKNKIIIN
ncbi:MAG: tRNA lysidine(34) synthetase TilS, partial [Chloroflexota bacterium]